MRRDIVDQFLNNDGLADAGATEQAGLAPLRVRLEQVDDLDTGLEQFFLRRQLIECRGRTVDRIPLLGFDISEAVDPFADHVDQSSENAGSDRDGHRSPRVDAGHAAHEAIR
jgi:hypothetical protein